MEEMEGFCRENGMKLRVYCVANNGFIEGKQNEPLMQTMEHFCERSGIRWGGGLGIGGGVMMNVMRIMLLVYLFRPKSAIYSIDIRKQPRRSKCFIILATAVQIVLLIAGYVFLLR
jgi:hypothetical protein